MKISQKLIEIKAKTFIKTILSFPTESLIYLYNVIREELKKRGVDIL